MDTSREVVLFRHGIAEAESADGRDTTRALTARGRERTGEAAAGLARMIDAPARVLHSPRVRARETAAILVAATGGEAEETTALEPDAPPGQLLDWVIAQPGVGPVVAVGHEPALSQWVATAIGAGAGAGIALGKAGAACVRITRDGWGRGELRWLLRPKTLRRLGGA